MHALLAGSDYAEPDSERRVKAKIVRAWLRRNLKSGPAHVRRTLYRRRAALHRTSRWNRTRCTRCFTRLLRNLNRRSKTADVGLEVAKLFGSRRRPVDYRLDHLGDFFP